MPVFSKCCGQIVGTREPKICPGCRQRVYETTIKPPPDYLASPRSPPEHLATTHGAPSSARGGVLDRLTDPKQFTGVQKQRFQELGGVVVPSASAVPLPVPVVLEATVAGDGAWRYTPRGRTADRTSGGSTTPLGTRASSVTPRPRSSSTDPRPERSAVQRSYSQSGDRPLSTPVRQVTPDRRRTINSPDTFRKSPLVARRLTENDGVFDRLTNPKLFTGTHQFRFDENGRGLGAQGRDTGPKGKGSLPTFATTFGGQRVKLEEITRSAANRWYARDYDWK
eukprot:TRINITY_DN6850_c0_g1_i1.p1 TRINITY_DN6850_c0_g1~~TRINITY_DN6850_c0_g1_i1.p1  ORF type:complete len:281 (-),score=19.83 TRINITY_DN6850_c0_g1_i1:32-874(-)